MGQGSLDLRIAEQAVREGWISSDDLEASRAVAASLRLKGIERDLTEVLLERDLLDQEQLRSLREKVSPDRELGGFRVLDQLGAGGMGKVFKAVQVSLERVVAVKVLDVRYASEPEFLARFQREARAAARLDHPNVVQVLDVGHDAGVHYIAMEFIEGESVLDRIKRRGPLPEAEATSIVHRVLSALSYAHSKGIVHRDVKPDNVLLGRDGAVKLADLGLARDEHAKEGGLTTTGAIMGTPNYISPEQAMGKPADTRSDLYSLGASYFHMVTGRTPFIEDSPVLVMTRHIQDPAPDPRSFAPDLSEDCARLILWLLEKDPGDRPQTPREALMRVEDLAGAAPSAPGWDGAPGQWTGVRADDAPTVLERAPEARPVRRRRWGRWVLVACVLLCAFWLYARRPRPNGGPGADSTRISTLPPLGALTDDGLPPWLEELDEPVEREVRQMRASQRRLFGPAGGEPGIALVIGLRLVLTALPERPPLLFLLPDKGRGPAGPQDNLFAVRDALVEGRLAHADSNLAVLAAGLAAIDPRGRPLERGVEEAGERVAALEADLAARRAFAAGDIVGALERWQQASNSDWLAERVKVWSGLVPTLQQLAAQAPLSLTWDYRPSRLYDFREAASADAWKLRPRDGATLDSAGLVLEGSREAPVKLSLRLPELETWLYADFQLSFAVELLGDEEPASFSVHLGDAELRAEDRRITVRHARKGGAEIFQHPSELGGTGPKTVFVSWGPERFRVATGDGVGDIVQLRAEPLGSVSFRARSRVRLVWVRIAPRGLPALD